MTANSQLRSKLRAELLRQHMLGPDSLAVVGVSGGADSVALLLALHELGLKLHVAHLDHGIRGAEGEADAEFVRQLCFRLEVPCTLGRRDVPAYKWEHKLSLEAAARDVRHDFLREMAAELGATAIFLAHTADDQVETFLLRLIRGAGVAGLAGMSPKDGPLRRPLLGVWRSEVEDYLRQKGQAWREDSSNRDRRFLRNRVRHELLPLLASMNPGIKQVLLREAFVLSNRQREIDAEVFRRLGLGSRQIGAALAGKAVILQGGRRLEPAPFEVELPVPGEAHVPGGRVVASVGADSSLDTRNDKVECFDAASVGPKLRVRSRRPGDRFTPLGMARSKKLQDFLVDEKVPRQDRDALPLVVRDDAIVWVVGLRMDERFKVTADTRSVVRLQFEPA